MICLFFKIIGTYLLRDLGIVLDMCDKKLITAG